MILTQGERMVWAAAYVEYVEKRIAEFGMCGIGGAAKAADHAGVVVQSMRDAADLVEERLEADRVQMLRAMLGDEG